ncbi:MAG: hypothetical protein Q7S56_03515 [Nanoarchaeota archaeon]|nr:hypothetical protein [Nanoarchaeota archaeon]
MSKTEIGPMRNYERYLETGYTEMSFGTSHSKGTNITGIWAFYHPNGEILTITRGRFIDPDGYWGNGRSEERYNQEEFQKFIDKFKVKMGPRKSLTEMVKNQK